MVELVFWGAVALVAYAYVGYAAALVLVGLIRKRPVLRTACTPPVTLIITAHNEESRIGVKLENTLAQQYPAEALEILVASDCSTDDTDEIVRRSSPRVGLVRTSERRGKEAAQHAAVKQASGDILVFSDVATALGPSALRTIVRNFADPTVGCVSSVDRFVDASGRLSGEGAYVRYEMLLRRLETRTNSLVGLSGSFFAARREVCRNWAPDRQSDFNTLLNTVRMGLRGVLDPESVGYYHNIRDDRQEFGRKTRTVVRGLFVLSRNLDMLNPVAYGWFAWQLASHKLCRWLVPFALIAVLLCNIALARGSTFYTATLVAQLLFYAAAIAGLRTGGRLLRIPAFFVLANVGIFVAWLRFARGERIATWNPSERMATLPKALP